MSYKLIVTFTKKGAASKIVAASKKAGAEGGTIMLGMGTANIEKYYDILGMNYGMEREVIFTFVPEDKADFVLQTIADVGKLEKPGNGISFIVNIKSLTGIFHLLKTQNS